MATIEFWGVMLFVIRSGVLVEVVFPDTRIDPPGNNKGNDPKKHHDGEIARPHFPAFLHVRANGSEKSHDLSDAQLVFAGGRHLIAAHELDALPDVSTASSGNLAHNDATPVAATVSMRLPSEAAVSFEFPGKDFCMPDSGRACPLVLRLTLNGDVTVCITAKGEVSSIQLQSGDTGIIHHSDVPQPSLQELRKPRSPKPIDGKIVDHDFKWLYALTSPQPGKSHFTELPLPAPTYALPDPAPLAVPSVSTCFPGRIGK